MRAFVDRHGLQAMTTIVDDGEVVWDRFGVRVQPAWAFLPAAGEVSYVFGGLFDDALAGELDARFGRTP